LYFAIDNDHESLVEKSYSWYKIRKDLIVIKQIVLFFRFRFRM